MPAVFCESTVSDKAQRQVAAESGARFGGALYVDSLSEAGGPVPSQEALLRRDAGTIELLGGAPFARTRELRADAALPGEQISLPLEPQVPSDRRFWRFAIGSTLGWRRRSSR